MKFFGKVINGKPSIVLASGESKGSWMTLDIFIAFNPNLEERMANAR